jgi:Uncharacterized protein involved in ubiquinone biosynthesis
MDDHITLRQGLEKFQQASKKYIAQSSISEKGKEFLRSHDIAHVLFGCDTSIYGEGVVKIWTTFGTTLGFWNVINGYQEAKAFELARQYSFGHVMNNICRLLIHIPKIIFRANKMRDQWPFTDYESYMDEPLSDIRAEFNIEILA